MFPKIPFAKIMYQIPRPRDTKIMYQIPRPHDTRPHDTLLLYDISFFSLFYFVIISDYNQHACNSIQRADEINRIKRISRK